MLRQFEPPVRDFECAPTPSGSNMKPVMKVGYDEDGCKVLVKESEVNIDDFINSFKDDCIVENIVRRFESGDVLVLNRVQGSYFDATQMPDSIHKANEILSNAEKVYKSLPKDIRQNYADISAFVGALTTDKGLFEFANRVNQFNQRAKKPDNGGDQ